MAPSSAQAETDSELRPFPGWLSDHAGSSPARWIWVPGCEYVNQHVYLRKRLELPAKPLRSCVRVTADTRYRLFVNSACLLRGPARGFPQALPYDELDLAPFLRLGPNVIAVHVLSFGVSTAQNVFRGRAGFLLEGVAECDGGAKAELHTNHTWRCMEAAGYLRHVSRCSPQLGYQEHYDAARDAALSSQQLGDVKGTAGTPVDWTATGYNDVSWQPPCVLGAPGVLPWCKLEERGIPPLETRLRPALRVGGQWEVTNASSAATSGDACNIVAVAAQEARRPAAKPFFYHAGLLCGESSFSGQKPVKLRRVPAGKSAALLFDFGETCYGYPVLAVAGAAGGEVFDLLYDNEAAEGERPAAVPPSGVAGAFSLADRLICRAGANRFETVQTRGLRFLTLIARNIRHPLTIEQLAIVETRYPAAQRGSFACSDPRLNAIWETGVRTLRHCMADTFLDCPARAQQQDWAATRIAGLACFYALGDSALYRRALRLMGQGLLPDGLLFGVVPSERPECVLLDYCLHWVASLGEYYQFTGDLETLKQHRSTLEKVLAFFSILAGERGLLGPAQNCSFFLDQASGLHRADSLSATFNLLYLHAIRHASRIAQSLDESGLASHCSLRAAELADRIRMVFASSRRNLLVETVDLITGEPGDTVSQHATALAVLEDMLGKRESDRTGPAAEVLDSFLPPPCDRPAPGPVRANLFFRAFVHEALARLGRGELALQDIRRTWGYMLDQGATTWWEGLPLQVAAGRCHAWSVHPTTFLSRHVLGLEPLEPGWKRFRVEPQALGLEHAAGKVPTPHGDIGILWRCSAPDKPLQIELDVPTGTEAQVFLAGEQSPRVLGPGSHRLGAPD